MFAVKLLRKLNLRSYGSFDVHCKRKHSTLTLKNIASQTGCFSYSTRAMSSPYTIVERGSQFGPDYKVYFKGPAGIISPFHDIPLFANPEKSVLNMVVEIPRWTNAKMEISRDEPLNPIKQDVKNGKLRFIDSVFPYTGYIWNYGALPQTWEDPNHRDVHTGQKGDNDPIDVCEIGSKVWNRGDVVQVKVLGAIALIDEGETDWKVLTISVSDPLASSINDIGDIEKHMPGYLTATRNWLEVYKMPSGKPANKFAFDGQPKDKKFALDIIHQTNDQWKQLMSGKADAGTINRANTTVTDSRFTLKQDAAKAAIESNSPVGKPLPVPAEAHKWHFLNR